MSAFIDAMNQPMINNSSVPSGVWNSVRTHLLSYASANPNESSKSLVAGDVAWVDMPDEGLLLIGQLLEAWQFDVTYKVSGGIIGGLLGQEPDEIVVAWR